jgi:hypothetical protein
VTKGTMVCVGFAALAIALQQSGECQQVLTNAPAVADSRTPAVRQPVAVREPVAIREIDNPETGDRWVLTRDSTNPAGPGRMVRIATAESQRSDSTSASATKSAPPLVIHAGDAVIVEEHTPVVDARLEALAMGSVAAGEEFNVRLKIGGKVIRAVALARGRASLVAERAGQP